MLIERGRVLFAMILREMNSRYGRSVGGYLWAVVEPISFILLFSIVFSVITRDPALGRSFPLFFATGVITFMMYRDIGGLVGGSFLRNKPLFTYPKITLLDAVLAGFLLQALTFIAVATMVFIGIYAIEDIRPHINPAPVLAAVSIAALIGLGVGMINCVLFPMFPTWQRIFEVISRPLFLISGVFYTPEMIPPDVRDVLLFNPLVHVIGLMRTGFYPTYHADYISFPYLIGAPLLLITVGILLLRRYQGYLLEQ
ncbi:MAG: ABC transporter permease [Pseudomonadota bacterium]